MAKQLQLRKGTTLDNNLFIGANAEITVDTESKDLRLHDGTKRGGFRIPTIIDMQLPTEQNGYAWYIKYSNGWCEQGGILLAAGATTTVVLATEMSSVNYFISVTQRLNRSGSDWNGNMHVISSTITENQFDVRTAATTDTNSIFWEVKGIYKQD